MTTVISEICQIPASAIDNKRVFQEFLTALNNEPLERLNYNHNFSKVISLDWVYYGGSPHEF